jgi:protein-disulfide isomerase
VAPRLSVSVAFAVVLAAMAACGRPVSDPTATSSDVDLPGVDTHEFTPREKHEFSRYVKELSAPCPSVAASLAVCVSEHRACAACTPAATAIAKAVREGMAHEQVETLYRMRFDPAAVKTIPLDGSPARGPDAPLATIVEFADFECPFCQQMAPALEALWEKRKDTVRFVFKYMPLAMHPHGEIAARAAIAADQQGKFWEMNRRLFGAGTRLDEKDLDGYANELGMNLDRFHADMHSRAANERLDADRKLADQLGVKGTPTLYVNGREYEAKVDLEEWVDSEIAAKRAGGTASSAR